MSINLDEKGLFSQVVLKSTVEKTLTGQSCVRVKSDKRNDEITLWRNWTTQSDDIWQAQNILRRNTWNGQDCVCVQMTAGRDILSGLSMVILRAEHSVPGLHQLAQWVIPIHSFTHHRRHFPRFSLTIWCSRCITHTFLLFWLWSFGIVNAQMPFLVCCHVYGTDWLKEDTFPILLRVIL